MYSYDSYTWTNFQGGYTWTNFQGGSGTQTKSENQNRVIWSLDDS